MSSLSVFRDMFKKNKYISRQVSAFKILFGLLCALTITDVIVIKDVKKILWSIVMLLIYNITQYIAHLFSNGYIFSRYKVVGGSLWGTLNSISAIF